MRLAQDHAPAPVRVRTCLSTDCSPGLSRGTIALLFYPLFAPRPRPLPAIIMFGCGYASQVIPNLELTAVDPTDVPRRDGEENEPTHFFGMFDG